MLHLHEPIHIHRYTLRSKAPLNAVVPGRAHEGALVKIGGGYGCLQPWPELGDQPLDRQLSILSKGGFTAMLERLRICCKLDEAARKLGRSEFVDFAIPPSHGYGELDGGVVKVKCGPDVAAEVARLKRFAAAKLRLDFNATLTPDSFRDFTRRLDDATAARIDFIEDPFDASFDVWEKVQKSVPFALASDRVPVPAAVEIVKPALHTMQRRRRRVVITSNMDHPIGQLFAAREAAAYYTAHPDQAEVCGLATHLLFEPDPFLERLRCDAENRLIFPGGTGFGFDDLLENLPWQRLV
jgi:O-succinylbenzoate synthase